MNIYARKQKWKLLLATFAFAIIIVSLWYSNDLVKKIAADERQKAKLWAEAVQKKANLVKFTNELFEKIKKEERKKAELYAEATRQLSASNDGVNPFVLKVLEDNTSVPVILTSQNNEILFSRNLDSTKEKDKNYLLAQLKIMQLLYPPVVVEYYKNKRQFLYHKDSKVFENIKLVFDSLIKSFITEVAVNSAGVPVLFINSKKDSVIDAGKIDKNNFKDKNTLTSKLNELSSQNQPIEVDFGNGQKNYIYYANSTLLTQLRYFPYVQFLVIGFFLLIAYVLFSTARKAEQDQVWVGMSKETAHQLGTPLSSLMAWNDYLANQGVEKTIINEMGEDLKRLQTITDRFSKIGSQPTLKSENINEVLNNIVNYLQKRSSKNVEYYINFSTENVSALLSLPLFEWVVENICKNAIDAMNGKGKITITVEGLPEWIYIDIEDTGKGIPKQKFKTVFEPGFTTKQRGWGLGLSLCKRIINNYHSGKIKVLKSEINKGATFRIEVKRA
ncbi:MAG: HAMP domain-containing histidine kinase [Bacteroidetes bacterium]|nr:HAMP domain-containing histidine kinase [Bacteroidota bacterium]